MKDPQLSPADLAWLAGFARALIGDTQGAEDLAQETAAAAYGGSLPTGGLPRAWLASVARRLAARRFRTEARRRHREARTARPEGLPDTTELVERAELAERVSRAARELDEPFRRTILLRFIEGQSPDQIARQDRTPVDTVRWRIRRGLELLRADLVRGSGRDWSAWCAALVPLARSHGGAGHATVGASGALAGSVAGWTTMKLAPLALAALTALGLRLVWEVLAHADPERDVSDDRVAGELGAAPGDPDRALPPARPDEGPRLVRVPLDPLADGAERTSAVPSAPDSAAALVIVHGEVVDSLGAAVKDATVYLVPRSVPDATPSRAFEAQPAARTTSDAQGRFRLTRADLGDDALAQAPALDLGVFANGFQRRVVPDALVTMPEGGLCIVLERGQALVGRVLDEDGRGVPALRLLAHTAGSSIDHVSPSERLLRSERAALAGATSRYFECHSVTEADGGVRFSGLAPGPVRILSLDAGWTLEEPQEVEAGGAFIVWTAVRRLGVAVTVLDATTDQRVAHAAATFRVELTFDDGSVEDVGQWVGRGAGQVSLVLGAGTLPDYGERVITGATFYGTVESEGRSAAWRAAPLTDPLGVTGVAEASVRVDGRPGLDTARTASGTQAPPARSATLELDVRYEDGAVFTGAPVVRWTSRSEGGDTTAGTARPSETAPGRFELDVPEGSVALTVSDHSAQGSLEPWSGNAQAEADRTTRVSATLTRGGEVSIARPLGYDGEWFVHAAWRTERDGEWRGSWTYSTTEDTLRLTALRPAEWRFRIRRAEQSVEAPVERVVSVAAGDVLSVEP